jgi:hypothetical protein
MSDDFQKWWTGNQTIIVFLVVQTLAMVIWGARVDNRVDVIEARGSPQIEMLNHRLTVVETLLGQNSQTLSRIESDMRNVSKDVKKVSPY